MQTEGITRSHTPYEKYNLLLINVIIYLSLFSVAFRILALALITMVLATLLLVSKFRARMQSYLVIGFFLVFFLLYYFLGIGHFERGPEKFTNLILLNLFCFMFFFMLGYFEAKKNINKYINFFSISSMLYVYLVCIYSQLNGYPGYNLVYDVVNGSEENSPLYALQLVIFSVVYINNNKVKGNLLTIIIISLLTFYFSAIYLGSRAAFILLVLYFILTYRYNLKRILLSMMFLLILAMLYIFSIDSLSWLNIQDFGGFSQRGLDSPRFSMLVYGIENFLNYPTGGLKVQAEGYTGIWFHNMFLDLVRVSGFYVMFMWLAVLIFVGIIFLKFREKNHNLIIYLILNIALMQDLAFDGFFNIMALEFYLIGNAVWLAFGRQQKMSQI